MPALLDLFATPPVRGSRDARDSARPHPSGGAVAPLSIGHKLTPSQNQAVAEAVAPPPERADIPFAIWKGAARADFPGIENRSPRKENQNPPAVVPRGVILSLSADSRRNLQRKLATILVAAEAYTMALTLPGDFSHLTQAKAKRAFLRLCAMFTAEAARCPILALVGFFWKQELQERGAIHFHLLLYGVNEETAKRVQEFLASLWNRLLCDRGCSEKTRRDHWEWHMSLKRGKDGTFVNNFQKVRNMHGYFAKYLGKAEKELVAAEPIPGRWWGAVNRKVIPFAERKELSLPVPVKVYSHRVTRKIRQVKANAAKHAAICRKLGLVTDGKPSVSQFELVSGSRWGKCVKQMAAHREVYETITDTATGQLFQVSYKEPVRFGKYKFHSQAKYGGIVLLGEQAPATALRILQYAGARAVEQAANCPF